MNETVIGEVSEAEVIDEVSEAEVIGDVSEVNVGAEAEQFADGAPKNNVEETSDGDDLINMSECSSIVLHVNENEGVISFRRDATNQVDIQIKSGVWGDITYVKQYKEPDGYFAHVFVTSNGWLVGNGGVTDGSVFRQIESITCEMVVNNVISDAYLSRVHNILSQYSLGHFVIKAPDGSYGIAFSDRYSTGKLQPGEYVVCPNLYSYSHKGSYDASLSPVDAAIRLGYTDSYGVNRRDLITYDWKLTTSSNGLCCVVDTYASNDNGAGVGSSTGGLADNINYLDRNYISRDSLPGTPGKMGLGTYVFENTKVEIFKLLSPINTAVVGESFDVKFQVNYITKSSPTVRFAVPDGFDFNGASVSKGSYEYDRGSHVVTWHLNDCDANNYITLSLKAVKSTQADLFFSLDNNFVNSVKLNANQYGALISTSNVNKYYKGSQNLNVYLKDSSNRPIAGENIVIRINGQSYTRQTDGNGLASLSLNLNAGSYDATVSYNGRFGSNSASVNVKISNTISGSDIVKLYKNDTQYYAKFLDTSGNPLANREVSFNINGVFYTRTTDGSGVARLNINLIPGDYILTAINLLNGEQHSNKVKVLTVLAEGHDVTKYYRNNSVYSIKVLDGRGNPLANADVSFNINGVFYTRQTNESGYANLNLRLQPGEYIVTADYMGLKCSNVVKILPVLFANDSVSYTNESNFEVILIDGQGNPYENQSVEFNINGFKYTNITDNRGIANLFVVLPDGEYIVTSTYDEFSISNKVTIKNEVK